MTNRENCNEKVPFAKKAATHNLDLKHAKGIKGKRLQSRVTLCLQIDSVWPSAEYNGITTNATSMVFSPSKKALPFLNEGGSMV